MSFFSRKPATPALSAQEAVTMSKKNEITIIDVRDISELRQTGKAKTALHIPLMLLQSHANPSHPEFNKALDTTKTVAVYCASGARSGMAARTLSKMGFESVHNIGGLMHWHSAGGELERA
ncbi:sulfurtransferase [Rhodobacterales bacterium 52_120_T64]|nr:sulfurtransferase [Rhodobacterales bacterium 52_120_T64]